jgi:hypothetical protein
LLHPRLIALLKHDERGTTEPPLSLSDLSPRSLALVKREEVVVPDAIRVGLNKLLTLRRLPYTDVRSLAVGEREEGIRLRVDRVDDLLAGPLPAFAAEVSDPWWGSLRGTLLMQRTCTSAIVISPLNGQTVAA